MSFHHVSWAMRWSETRGSARIVMLVLAHHANDQNESYPSVPTLVKETRLGRSTVIETLGKMAAAGDIERIGAHPDPRYKGVTVYLLPDPWIGGPEAGPVQSDGSRGSTTRTQKEKANDHAGGTRAGTADSISEARQLYPALPDDQKAALKAVVAVANAKGVKRRWRAGGVVEACEKYATRDIAAEADTFEFYWLRGVGENRPVRDPVATWRNWLKGAPTAATRRQATRRRGRDQEARVERINKDLEAIERLKGAAA